MAYTSVKITADANDYRSQMKAATAQMKELSSEYSVAATKAKLFGSETDTLKAKAESLNQKITVQEKIVKMNKEQQERLTEQLTKQKTEQEGLKSKLEATKRAYEDEKRATGENSDATKALKEELNKLEEKLRDNETQIGKSETALGSQTAKVNQSKVKLMEMQSELKNVNKELKEHKLSVFADACDKTGEKIENFGKKMTIVSGGIVGFGTMVGKNALDTENDLMKIQGQLGLTAEETEKLKNVAQNLYKNGFGEGLEDCASGVVTLLQNIKETRTMSAEQQQEVAEQMMTMSDMFATENAELTKTLTTMLDNGIIDNISQGMDVLTIGFQNGADYSGELLDTMREYSPKFKELGMDAETAMAYLIQGAQNGAFNLDKVGDAIKEFSIRAVDGSDTTVDGFKKIGLNADDMAQKFAAGGDSASQAFKDTLVALNSMSDPIAQNTAGVDLFGTMWEDLGKDVILSLADVEGGLQNVEGATVRAGEQVNNSFSTELKSQFRELQTSLLPLGDELLRLGKEALPTVKEVIGIVTDKLKGMDSETAQNVIKIGAVVAAVGPLAVGFGKATQGISATVNVVKKITSSTNLLGNTIKGLGIIAVVAIVAKIITYLVDLYQHNEEFREGVDRVWATVKSVFGKIGEIFGKAGEVIGNVMKAAGDTVKEKLGNMKAAYEENGGGIKGVVAAGWEGIKGYYTAGFTFIDNLTGGKLTEIKNKFLDSSIGQAVSTAFNGIKDASSAGMTAAVDTVKEKLGNMKAAYEENGGGIQGVAAATMEGVIGYYTSGLTFVDNLTGGKLTEIKNKFLDSSIGQAVSTAFNGIKDASSAGMTATVETVKEKLGNMKAAYEENGGGIRGVTAATMEGIKGYYTSGLTFVDKVSGGKLTEIKTKFFDKTAEIREKVSNEFTNIQTSIESRMKESSEKVSKKLNTIRQDFWSELNEAYSTVSQIMEKIRLKIEEKMENAGNIVSGAIEKIKGFFDFDWSFPELKLPHFKMEGKFSLNPPSVPSIDVEWYKTGGIMTSPTVFGINGTKFMVGGEAGAEAILPLEQFYTRLGEMLDRILNTEDRRGDSKINIIMNMDDVIDRLDRIEDLINNLSLTEILQLVPDERRLFKLIRRIAAIEQETTGKKQLS